MKTQDEVLERFTKIHSGGDDLFGFRQEALLDAMTLETAKRTNLLPADIDESQWTDADISVTARQYLLFAIGKVLNHRGLSAGCSIEKLEEWAWVLGDEVVLNRFVDAPYPQYGAPKLDVLVEAWGMREAAGVTIADEGFTPESWQRMARGDVCVDFCQRGCGV